MDTSRLPAYRSSYLLRFHPYARVKLSTRERIATSASENGSYERFDMSTFLTDSDIPFTLHQAIHGSDVHTQLRERHLSVTSLVVDLALLFAKKSSARDKQ